MRKKFLLILFFSKEKNVNKNKKAPAVPHWDGEALLARFHSPVSLREASIAAQTAGIAPPTPGRTFPPPPGGPLAAGGGPSLSVERRYSSRSLWLYLHYITSAPHLCQGRGGIFPRLPQNAFTCGKPYGAGGARGGEARLESNQMPRKALHRKACGSRSENFPTVRQWESNGICRLSQKSGRTFGTVWRGAPPRAANSSLKQCTRTRRWSR